MPKGLPLACRLGQVLQNVLHFEVATGDPHPFETQEKRPSTTLLVLGQCADPLDHGVLQKLLLIYSIPRACYTKISTLFTHRFAKQLFLRESNLMNKKITIRDVAQAAGVSISTVHRALNDKPGVSEVTREHIRRIADDLGYRPNKMASGLKRRTQRVAVLLPDEVGRNRFYYPPLWQGVRDYLKNSEDPNVECTEFSFPNEIDPSHSRGVEEVRALLAEDKLDGLLTVGHMEAMTMQEWQHARDAGVAVVQVGFRNPKIAPLCSVQPDYEVIGRTMAELIFSHIPSFGSVVLCAGNPKWEQHARIVQGFEDYMQENGAQNRIYLDNSCYTGSEAQRNILNLLEKPDVAACCSVLSQGSVMLVQGLQQCGKAGKVFAVGSDVFEENLDALRNRILDNIVQKNLTLKGILASKHWWNISCRARLRNSAPFTWALKWCSAATL